MCFCQSAFITSQVLFVLAKVVLKRYLTNMNSVYPNVHTLVKLMLTISCTTVSLERSVSRLKLLRVYL